MSDTKPETVLYDSEPMAGGGPVRRVTLTADGAEVARLKKEHAEMLALLRELANDWGPYDRCAICGTPTLGNHGLVLGKPCRLGALLARIDGKAPF